MTPKSFTSALALATMLQFAPCARAQDIDDANQVREHRAREARVNSLSIEEQLKLRAAEQKAAEDPEVQVALEKRKVAVREFRAVLRASMLKSNPNLKPILDKIAAGGN